MKTVEKYVEVQVPVEVAYQAWTRFEDFPRFMEGVEEVRNLGGNRYHWVAEIGGKREEWDAEVTEKTENQRIAWTSTSGAENAGVVTFHRLSDTHCRVTLQLGYEPEGVIEAVGSAIGVPDRRIEGDLERFKELIESRSTPYGSQSMQMSDLPDTTIVD
jgi:uncharacterized membrane protein